MPSGGSLDSLDSDPFAELNLPKSRAGDVTSTGLRVLPAVAGGFFGPVGGAVGAGAGELIAQLYEGEGFNPSQVALQAGLGAIPGAKAFRDLKGFSGMLARGGVNAAVGAAIGGPSQVLTEEVAREGLKGFDVFDLEPGVMDRMERGAMFGSMFGGGASLGLDAGAAALRGRASTRQATIDGQFDPDFEARYKAAAAPRWNGDASMPRTAATSLTPMAPDLSYGLPPAIPLPPPAPLPDVIPQPFAPPPPVAPVESMPLMARPTRQYDELFDGLEEAAPVAEPALSPELQALVDMGVDPAVARQLTPADAAEVMRGLQDDIPPTTLVREGLEGPNAELFDAYMARALEANPDVMPSTVRENFDFSLERFLDANQVEPEGLTPQEIMKAIAARGGLQEADDFAGDQWNRERRPNAELQRMKDLAGWSGYTTSGRFGSALGVPGVFRKAGRTIDGMVADLRDDPRFAEAQYPNDLIKLFEDAVTRDQRAKARRTTPTLDDLALPESMTAIGARTVEEPNPLDEILRIFADEEIAASGVPVEDVSTVARRELAAMGARDLEAMSAVRGTAQDVPMTDVAQRLEAERNLPADAELEALMAREAVPVVEDWKRPGKGDVLEDVLPTAKFGGMQDDGLGGEFPIYTLEGGPRDGSTVGADTLRQMGIEPPPMAGRAPQDVLLPGTEDVRRVENATPEVADVPFSLEAPQGAVKAERAARGAKEADSQSSLDDFFGNPERGAIAPGALGSVAGGVTGATGGALSIDEDDTTGEKVAKVLGGAAVGAGAGGAIGARVGNPPAAANGGRGAPPASAPTTRPSATAAETITTPRGRPVALPKYAGNINLERLNTTDGVKATIDQIARDLRPQMENARRGRIAQDVTRQMAAELGMTEAELLSRRRGQAFNAEQALAAREINAASARRLTEAANAVREAPTPENYTRLMSSLQQQVAIQEQIAGATAEAGRSLAQFRMMANDTLSLPELNELVMSAGGTESMDALARRIQEIDPTNIRAMNQFAREASKATMGDKVYEAWINALLSGPVTHVANTISNGLTVATHPVEKTVAGLLDMLRAKVSGTPQERFAREGAYAVAGLWKGVSGALRAGLTSAISDTPSFGIGRQEQTPGGKIGGTLGHVVRAPSKALLFEDEFFKNIVYSADLHARALRTAAREGLKGRALGDRVAEILQNPPENMRAAGQKEALYRTFNTPLTARWEKALMNLRASVPGARWIIPFVRTPINVAKFGLERTPLQLGNVIAKIAKGDLSIPELGEEGAKVAIGASLAMGVAAAYENGMITGGGSPDRSKHATEAVTRPDYSMKIGDQWYSFQRLEPLGISIGLVADFMESLKTGKQSPEQLPAKLLYSFAKNIQSKTFLQGLTGFFNVLSDYPRYGDEWINRMGGSIVPTAVAQVARANDPIARKPGSVKEAIVNRMGGGESLPPMLDVFGRPITSDMDPLERLLSPVQRRNVVDDPLVDELGRLGITLSVPSERLTVEGHELTRAQKSTLAQARGQSVKRELDELLDSPTFQRLDDDDRRERIERAINQARDAVARKARSRIRRDVPLTLEDLLGIEPAQ